MDTEYKDYIIRMLENILEKDSLSDVRNYAYEMLEDLQVE